MFNRLLQRLTKKNAMPPAGRACFFVAKIEFKGREVGRLTREKGIWSFEYSSYFKNQTELAPITDFPDKEAIYKSETLWPFFALRIPSLTQPQVREFLRASSPADPEVALLKKFGRYSVANPFELQVAQ